MSDYGYRNNNNNNNSGGFNKRKYDNSNERKTLIFLNSFLTEDVYICVLTLNNSRKRGEVRFKLTNLVSFFYEHIFLYDQEYFNNYLSPKL